jgi:hypothetical protein
MPEAVPNRTFSILLRMTDAMTTHDIDLPFWDILYKQGYSWSETPESW